MDGISFMLEEQPEERRRQPGEARRPAPTPQKKAVATGVAPTATAPSNNNTTRMGSSGSKWSLNSGYDSAPTTSSSNNNNTTPAKKDFGGSVNGVNPQTSGPQMFRDSPSASYAKAPVPPPSQSSSKSNNNINNSSSSASTPHRTLAADGGSAVLGGRGVKRPAPTSATSSGLGGNSASSSQQVSTNPYANKTAATAQQNNGSSNSSTTSSGLQPSAPKSTSPAGGTRGNYSSSSNNSSVGNYGSGGSSSSRGGGLQLGVDSVTIGGGSHNNTSATTTTNNKSSSSGSNSSSSGSDLNRTSTSASSSSTSSSKPSTTKASSPAMAFGDCEWGDDEEQENNNRRTAAPAVAPRASPQNSTNPGMAGGGTGGGGKKVKTETKGETKMSPTVGTTVVGDDGVEYEMMGFGDVVFKVPKRKIQVDDTPVIHKAQTLGEMSSSDGPLGQVGKKGSGDPLALSGNSSTSGGSATTDEELMMSLSGSGNPMLSKSGRMRASLVQAVVDELDSPMEIKEGAVNPTHQQQNASAGGNPQHVDDEAIRLFDDDEPVVRVPSAKSSAIDMSSFGDFDLGGGSEDEDRTQARRRAAPAPTRSAPKGPPKPMKSILKGPPRNGDANSEEKTKPPQKKPEAPLVGQSPNGFTFGDLGDVFTSSVQPSAKPLPKAKPDPSSTTKGNPQPAGATAAAASWDGSESSSRIIVPKKFFIKGFSLSNTIGHPGKVRGLVSCDTKDMLIVSVAGDELTASGHRRGVVSLQHQKYSAHADIVLHISVSIDGRFIATAGNDGTLFVHDTHTAKRVAAMRHPGPVTCSAFAENGRFVVSGCHDGSCRLFSTKGEGPLRVASVHGDASVETVALQPHGEFAASGGSDGSLRLWRSASGLSCQLDNTSAKSRRTLLHVVFAHKGQWLLSLDPTCLVVTDVKTGTALTVVQSKSISCDVHRLKKRNGVTGRYMFAACTLLAFNPATGWGGVAAKVSPKDKASQQQRQQNSEEGGSSTDSGIFDSGGMDDLVVLAGNDKVVRVMRLHVQAKTNRPPAVGSPVAPNSPKPPASARPAFDRNNVSQTPQLMEDPLSPLTSNPPQEILSFSTKGIPCVMNSGKGNCLLCGDTSGNVYVVKLDHVKGNVSFM